MNSLSPSTAYTEAEHRLSMLTLPITTEESSALFRVIATPAALQQKTPLGQKIADLREQQAKANREALIDRALAMTTGAIITVAGGPLSDALLITALASTSNMVATKTMTTPQAIEIDQADRILAEASEKLTQSIGQRPLVSKAVLKTLELIDQKIIDEAHLHAGQQIEKIDLPKLYAQLSNARTLLSEALEQGKFPLQNALDKPFNAVIRHEMPPLPVTSETGPITR